MVLSATWKSSEKSYIAGCKQFMRLLEHAEDNFLLLVLYKPTREALLDLVSTNADECNKEHKIGGSLVCSDPALVES